MGLACGALGSLNLALAGRRRCPAWFIRLFQQRLGVP